MAKQTKADVIRQAMRFSDYGAMSQLFIIDSMQKHISPAPTHRPREDNEKLVARHLRFNPEPVIRAVTVQAEGVVKAGLPGTINAFAKSGMDGLINPAAWHGVAVEILGKLQTAT